MQTNSTPIHQRRLLTLRQGSDYAGVCRTKLYGEAKAGRLKLLKIGGSTRIERSELDRWIDESVA
ncbi:helix-turn-helix domain-containing protein [Pseudooceanicola sp. MF1-13]|uniref:helix-turn-helix domain-containing protein n=1 Tax=Pseudooceanicola sp. MF1-13 TaxID=3379095 RepID=UPI003891D3F2